MAGKIVYLKKSQYEILDDEESRFLAYLRRESRETYLGNPQLASVLYNAFKSCLNPYVMALKLSYGSGDFHSNKPKSLAVFIFLKLSDFLAENKVEPLKDTQTMLDALRLVLEQKNNTLRNIVIRVFNMQSERLSFVPYITELIENRKYKDACQVAELLRLHSYFTPEDLLLPLFVQDKLSVVDDFVSSDEGALHTFLKYMDDLLSERTYDRVSAIVSSKEVPEWKGINCGHKPIIKFMMRLLKKHRLPPSTCPHMELRKKFSALHYLMSRRFDYGEASESWEEMVLDIVGDCLKMKIEMVECICVKGEYGEALHFAHKFGLKHDEMPSELVDYREVSSGEMHRIRGKSNPSESNFYQLPLSQDKIIFVDNEELFLKFLDRLKFVDLVGVDAEWKPSLITQNELALIQVATRSEVYVIDRITLAQSIPKVLSDGLTNGLFHNKEIMKLGFDFTSDLSSLKAVLPDLQEMSHLVDISTLTKVLKDFYKFRFPYSSKSLESSGSKLKNITEMCFNKTLDKTEQCSNWERRPLRPSQIEYAALDAYCLITIFDVIREHCQMQKIPLDEEIIDRLTNRPSQWQLGRPKPQKSPSDTKDFHFICTWELAVLYKKLRRCGIDTLYCNSRQPKKQYLKLMQGDYVCLTTVGQTWLSSPMKSHRVPPVDSETQLHRVLKDFGIDVLPENTNERCPECNGTEFQPLSSDGIRKIKDHNVQAASSTGGFLPAELADDDNGFDDDDFDGCDDFDEPCQTPVPRRAMEQGPVKYTLSGALIQVDKVPLPILEEIEVFYVCCECGHITWTTSLDKLFLYD